MISQNRTILKNVGEIFKTYRKKCGYSRPEVAQKLGVAPRTLAAYERGEREMGITLAVRLANIYGTTVRCLLGKKLSWEEEDA